MLQSSGAYSFLELFNRADVRVLLWLNQFVAAQPALYALALFLTDKGSLLLVLVTLVGLWFWPAAEQSRTLFGDADLSRRPTAHASLWHRWQENIARENAYRPAITRTQSRAQVLLWGFGALTAYLVARLLAAALDVGRPFTSYWNVRQPSGFAGLFEGLRGSGSFPSGHAALVAAFVCALFFWNRRLALVWAVIALVLSVCRVAVGFHYPMDVWGGALIGLACTLPLLRAYHRQGSLFRGANELARAFDLSNAPYCYLLYFLLLLIGLEAASHFSHLLQMFYALGGGLLNPRQG